MTTSPACTITLSLLLLPVQKYSSQPNFLIKKLTSKTD
jgi:hypothetical protein